MTPPPDGATVTFELYSDAETAGTQKTTGETVVLNGKVDKAAQNEVTDADTQEVNAAAITANAYESES